MMSNDKYAQMLMDLADQRPELKKDIMALHDELMADNEPDVAAENDSMSEMREPDSMDEEAENEPHLGPRPDKNRIPKELMDEEDEEDGEGPSLEIAMLAPRKGKK